MFLLRAFRGNVLYSENTLSTAFPPMALVHHRVERKEEQKLGVGRKRQGLVRRVKKKNPNPTTRSRVHE